MDSREFAEWLAYEQVSGPLGPERFDVLHAVQMAMVYNQWAKKPKKPKDFLPVWDHKPKQQTPEEMLQALRVISAMHGGKEEHVDDS